MKRCLRCLAEKPEGEFGRDRSRAGGLARYCKECERARDRQRGPRRDATEKRRAATRQWHKENHERRLEYLRRYRMENWEKVRAKERHHDHRRRAAMRITDLTPADELALRAARTYCPMPGCRKKMTDERGPRQKSLDHIIPLGVGGRHTRDNVRVICLACNLRRPKDGLDFVGQLGLGQDAA